MDPFGPATSALFLLAVLITLGYLASCVLAPYRACRHCQGYGQLPGLLGGFRLCGRCDGSGLRLRTGRRVINAATRLYRDLRDR